MRTRPLIALYFTGFLSGLLFARGLHDLGKRVPRPATEAKPPTPTHLVVDAWGAPRALLDDAAAMEKIFLKVVRAARLTVLDTTAHEFDPEGLTMLWLLSESHLAVHTWPEAGYAAFDLLSCSDADLYDVAKILEEALYDAADGPVDVRFTLARRGVRPGAVRVEDDLGMMLAEAGTFKARRAKVRSRHQSIEIWDVEGQSRLYGDLVAPARLLFLDGVQQVSTQDEATYHEALVLPALSAHGAARRVAVLGGGDGGALREALNFRSVEEAVVVELDPTVVETSRDWLPSLADTFRDPRAKVVDGDAFAWLRERRPGELDACFVDVLDVDSASPLIDALLARPGEVAADLRKAVGPRGVAVFQLGERPDTDFCWAPSGKTPADPSCKATAKQLEVIAAMRGAFAHVKVYSVVVKSWFADWLIVAGTDDGAAAARWTAMADGAREIPLDLLYETESLDWFSAAAMAGLRTPPVVAKLAAPAPPRNAESLAADHAHRCPSVEALAPNAETGGFAVPYRLARSTVTGGLGIYLLDRVRTGDVIWRFRDEDFTRVTEANWKELVDQELAARTWKYAPDLDAVAAAAAADPSKRDAARAAFLKRDWINEYADPDLSVDDDDYDEAPDAHLMLDRGDTRYMNHGYQSSFGTDFARQADLVLDEALGKAWAAGRVILATRDIDPCAELLEDYWSDTDEFERGYGTPEWFSAARDALGVREYLEWPGYRWTTSAAANID